MANKVNQLMVRNIKITHISEELRLLSGLVVDWLSRRFLWPFKSRPARAFPNSAGCYQCSRRLPLVTPARGQLRGHGL